jgi:hypothetical protein
MSPLKAIFGKKQRKRNFQEREVFSGERLSENYPTRLIPTIQNYKMPKQILKTNANQKSKKKICRKEWQQFSGSRFP